MFECPMSLFEKKEDESVQQSTLSPHLRRKWSSSSLTPMLQVIECQAERKFIEKDMRQVDRKRRAK
jgi:hypothetical protein